MSGLSTHQELLSHTHQKRNLRTPTLHPSPKSCHPHPNRFNLAHLSLTMPVKCKTCGRREDKSPSRFVERGELWGPICQSCKSTKWRNQNSALLKTKRPRSPDFYSMATPAKVARTGAAAWTGAASVTHEAAACNPGSGQYNNATGTDRVGRGIRPYMG